MMQSTEREFKIYPYPVDPQNYAEFYRRHARAVIREDIDNRIQFTVLRIFSIDENNELKNYKDDLDLYTKDLKLGKVVWPIYKTLLANNFKDLVDEIKTRGLYLFDFWGYVPGSFPDKSPWGQYKPGPSTVEYIRETLGNHFLGFDNGEQDGRYIGGYAAMVCPAYDERKRQYLNFQEHFEALGDDMQNQMSVLCSLNFCHYFAKEGNAIILGAETAQGLLNANLWYSYLRGAGRQYGLMWFGNASVWNRWGYKSYESDGQLNDYYNYGTDCGTSLSLLRRLLYTEYMYNCDILGFEQSWILGDNTEKRLMGLPVPMYEDPSTKVLTPIGEIQAAAVRFVEKYGYPGVMYTPVAILMDFYNGWTPPRHLYTRYAYKVWGNLPYEEGDYQVHALFNMLYPGYEDSGFFKNEKGFLAATPYSDMTDVLFSDVRQPVLNSYNTVILAGKIKPDAEVFDKLGRFVKDGGHLVISIEQILPAYRDLENYEPGFLNFFGIDTVADKLTFEDGETISYGNAQIVEKAFNIYRVKPTRDANVKAFLLKDNLPLILSVIRMKGRISLITAPYGLNSEKLERRVIEEKEAVYRFRPDVQAQKASLALDNTENKSIPLFYDYLITVKQYLDECLEKEKIIDIKNKRLQYCVNICDGGDLKVAVVNNGDRTESFVMETNTGEITAVEELEINDIAKDVKGYYAEGKRIEYDREAEEGKLNIEPKDIRIYKLKMERQNFEKKDQILIKENTCGKFVALRDISSLKEKILFTPTLRNHFCGVKIDSKYLADRDIKALRKEAEYIKKQKIEVIADFSSLLNHYPGLTFLDNIKSRYEESMETIESVFKKAEVLGCKKAVFILHRNAENHITIEEAIEIFGNSIKRACKISQQYGITVYLQSSTKARLFESTGELVKFMEDLKVDNLKFAYNTCHGFMVEEKPEEVIERYKGKICALLLSAPQCDDYGQYHDSHGAIRRSVFEKRIREIYLKAVQSNQLDFICLDGVYSNWNEIYLDRQLF